MNFIYCNFVYDCIKWLTNKYCNKTVLYMCHEETNLCKLQSAVLYLFINNFLHADCKNFDIKSMHTHKIN